MTFPQMWRNGFATTFAGVPPAGKWWPVSALFALSSAPGTDSNMPNRGNNA